MGWQLPLQTELGLDLGSVNGLCCCACAFLQFRRAGASLWLHRCAGFSLQWPLLQQSTGSRAHGLTGFGSGTSRALVHRLNCCGAEAWLLCGLWDLFGPGIEPVSPALAGGFITTEPPGKPLIAVLNYIF